MSKYLLLSAVAVACAMAGAAQAQEASNSDSKNVPVTGSVASLCVLGSPSPTAVSMGQMAQTTGADVGKLAALGSRTVDLNGTFCNFAGTRVTVSATALVASDTSATPNFTRAVNFNASVSGWAPTAASATTGATSDGATPTASGQGGILNTPKLANLQLTLSSFTAPGGLLLLASNNYAGSVTITVSPAAVPQ